VGCGPRNSQLDFGGNPNHDLDPGFLSLDLDPDSKKLCTDFDEIFWRVATSTNMDHSLDPGFISWSRSGIFYLLLSAEVSALYIVSYILFVLWNSNVVVYQRQVEMMWVCCICTFMCRMYVADNGSLIITSTQENDSAVYQCFAVSDVGETSATVLLTIFSTFSLCYLLNPCSISITIPHKLVSLFSSISELQLLSRC